MDRIDRNRIVFIISHKYFRGYESNVEYYINNINSFYINPLIIVVDNNSSHKEDIFDNLKKYNNVVLLDNNISSKFELGAYTVGLNYLLSNKLDYDYIVCTQDNFIIKNRFDFNTLYDNNIKACPLVGCYQDPSQREYSDIHNDCRDVAIPVLTRLNLYDNMDKVSFCWCNSFVISYDKLEQLYDYIKDIVVTIRWESCASERYMARILWELNEGGDNYAIDGDLRDIKNKYDCHLTDIKSDVTSFFIKKCQNKNEHTRDT